MCLHTFGRGRKSFSCLCVQEKTGLTGRDQVDEVHSMVKAYVEGLCWVMAYYYDGVASWTWWDHSMNICTLLLLLGGRCIMMLVGSLWPRLQQGAAQLTQAPSSLQSGYSQAPADSECFAADVQVLPFPLCTLCLGPAQPAAAGHPL